MGAFASVPVTGAGSAVPAERPIVAGSRPAASALPHRARRAKLLHERASVLLGRYRAGHA